MDSFRDKTIIITGGSEGVGAATARKFADAGAKLLLAARGRQNLEKIAEELRLKTEVRIAVMDVADAQACVALFDQAISEFGSVHVLINNAGYHERGYAETIAAEKLGRMIDVNLKAPIMLCRLAIPFMRKADGGAAIVNVASLAGRLPVRGAATYSASKFGLRAFTFALGEELRDTEIKLAVISPGPIDTGFIMSNIDSVEDIVFSQPMSTSEQVADEILKLCRNDRRERSMPPFSGFLTTLSYLFPSLGRKLQPALDRRGRRVKHRLKVKMDMQVRDKVEKE